MSFIDILNILLAFIGIWIGASLAVKPIDEIAKKVNSSSFIVSFFVLGFFTSLTEISVAINSIINDSIEISVGNLLGGSLVLILFVIPLLGILAKGIHLKNGFGVIGTFLSIIFLLVPHLFLLNNNLSINESLIMFVMFFVISIFLYLRDKNQITHKTKKLKRTPLQLKSFSFALLVVAIGSSLLLLSSNIVVNGIEQFAINTNISPFVISLIGLSIGTNLPEISLAIISAIKGKSEIGFGNYLGSALFNPFLLSIIGIISGGIFINENFTNILIFSVIGFILFFVFSKSKNFLSQKESFILLSIYLLFITIEISSVI